MTKELAGFKFIVKNGFQSELPQVANEMDNTSSPVIESVLPIASESVEVKEVVQELDVPTFMKGKKIPAPISFENNVVYVDFGKEEPTIEEKALSWMKTLWSGMADSIRRRINNALKGGDK